MLLSPILKTGVILEHFKKRNLVDEYLLHHLKRYELLLNQTSKIVATLSFNYKTMKILDLGPSFQTEILRCSYPQILIDSLGFIDTRFNSSFKAKHYEYDLNNTQNRKKWLKIKNYDIVIMAEIIEHLHTSPFLVFKCINSWIKPQGYLIIQTPNAVSLSRRIKMLFGRNPYDMIRESTFNPGHFREYTLQELIDIGQQANFRVTYYTIRNYFPHKYKMGFVYDFICKFLPKTFGDGITICLRKK